jgi:hypothetical protein
VQTQPEQDFPLKEVSTGKPYRVRGMAPGANNLMDVSRHSSFN